MIEAANAGLSGSATRGAETIITGQSAINTTGQVAIDRVEFLDAQTYSSLSSLDTFVSLTINETSTAGDIVENSGFDRTPAGDSGSAKGICEFGEPADAARHRDRLGRGGRFRYDR